MISQNELIKISKAEGLKPYQGEKKYIQSIILSSLYSYLANELVFKGGTALFFFMGLNRFSEDLEFTQTNKFNITRLVEHIHTSLSIRNMEGLVKKKKSITGQNILASAKGPLFSTPVSECHVTLQVSSRNDLVLDPVVKDYMPVYDDIMPFSLIIMDPREIAAEKVRVIQKRNYARDVYDLWFLLKKGYIPNNDLISEKMKYYQEVFSRKKLLMEIKEKEKIWEAELDPIIIGRLPGFKTCLKDIEDMI